MRGDLLLECGHAVLDSPELDQCWCSTCNTMKKVEHFDDYPKTCDRAKESRRSPVPHDYEVTGEDYGALGAGGSYEVLTCRRCGRVAYSPLPD